MAQTMGQIIKSLRREREITQEALAEQLNVTPQAVSKWENDSGMPDISQIIPLTSVLGVSADTLFGIDGRSPDDEALKIVGKAQRIMEYGEPESYLAAYDVILEGLQKYPNSPVLLVNGMNLGLSLALPENDGIYCAERAAEISAETIKQAKLVVSHSKSTPDILRARQALLLLYCAAGDYDTAREQAREFPAAPSMTLYSNMAYVANKAGDTEREAAYLSSDIDYTLQHFEDLTARLGTAYYRAGKFAEAAAAYETVFAVMRAVFSGGRFPPYHDFDSGDCYLLLAKAYLALGEREKAMSALECSVDYYLNVFDEAGGDEITWRDIKMLSPLVKNTELNVCVDRKTAQAKLRGKLSRAELEPLRDDGRYGALIAKVNEFLK